MNNVIQSKPKPEPSDLMGLYEGTNTTTEPETLTMDKILQAKAMLEANDPVADYMREKGFDPDKGCLLYMPAIEYDRVAFHTAYMRRSALIDGPFMVNTKDYDLFWP